MEATRPGIALGAAPWLGACASALFSALNEQGMSAE